MPKARRFIVVPCVQQVYFSSEPMLIESHPFQPSKHACHKMDSSGSFKNNKHLSRIALVDIVL